ncbi:MAG: hypothetical protein IPG07_06210 [Crocinitomicaceae bacterium]|nr:hypothetical protein [Crocinitomicaceae bacterium]
MRTYKFHELYDNATLFPIFNTEVEFLNQQMGSGTHLVVGYKEKGHLAKYVIKSDQFIPHELKVHIVEFAEASLVVKLFYKITYFGIALKSIKESTLITGTVAKIIKIIVSFNDTFESFFKTQAKKQFLPRHILSP